MAAVISNQMVLQPIYGPPCQRIELVQHHSSRHTLVLYAESSHTLVLEVCKK